MLGPRYRTGENAEEKFGSLEKIVLVLLNQGEDSSDYPTHDPNQYTVPGNWLSNRIP